MAKTTRKKTGSRASTRRGSAAGPDFDTTKFDNFRQIGGIQTAELNPGTAEATWVALVNTGAGLRFTIALDRGGDIIDASYNQHSLAYLTAVGTAPPSHAYHTGLDWLANWPGGLLTTCGPRYIGHPRTEDGVEVSLHGHHSNTPARVEMILNPDPHAGRREMLISMTIRDAAMYGPIIEVRRQIQCVLGSPQIVLYDQVTNRGDEPTAHHWLYHVNFGYPLLSPGARLIYKGKADYWQMPDPPARPLTAARMNALKTVAENLPEHAGAGERGLIVQVKPDRKGDAHVGIINDELGLGVELAYPVKALPRIANWQHFGPRGCYVSGIEPFAGSVFGKAKDDHPSAEQYLKPGETRRYHMALTVHHDASALAAFARHDGEVRPV